MDCINSDSYVQKYRLSSFVKGRFCFVKWVWKYLCFFKVSKMADVGWYALLGVGSWLFHDWLWRKWAFVLIIWVQIFVTDHTMIIGCLKYIQRLQISSDSLRSDKMILNLNLSKHHVLVDFSIHDYKQNSNCQVFGHRIHTVLILELYHFNKSIFKVSYL